MVYFDDVFSRVLKVADCVALMSLNKPQVVPVDTHVLQIAIRDYRIPGQLNSVHTIIIENIPR